MKEAHQRRAVAGLGGAVAGDLGFVLHRLGEHGRVTLLEHPGARFLQRLENGGDRALGVGGDGLALHRFEMGLEIPPLMDADAVAEMLADILAKLFRGDEEVGGAIVMDKGGSEETTSELQSLMRIS